MKWTVGIGALLFALLVGLTLPARPRLHAEVLARLELATVATGAALLASAESFQTGKNNWIVVLHDANVACPAGLLIGGRLNPCSAHPGFRDVAYCVDQAWAVLGETGGPDRIAISEADLTWCR